MRKTIYDEAMVTDQFQASVKNNITRGIHFFTKTYSGRNVAYLYFVFIMVITIFRITKYKTNPILQSNILYTISLFELFLFAYIIIPIALCYLFGKPWIYNNLEKAFIKAGIVNAAAEPPSVLYKRKEGKATILVIKANGISPTILTEAIPTLQTALNVNIAKIIEVKDKSTYEIWTVAADAMLTSIQWDDNFTSKNDAIIKLGTGYLGDITYDCDNNPHACIVASSGGGKTRLLFSIIKQFINQNSKVYVVDMKGGADFKRFGNMIHLATTEEDVLKQLKEIIHEMDIRKGLFYDANVTNIIEYRKKSNSKMPRILFCVDEAIQLLDKTGMKKEEKAMFDEIEKHITTISQMGRSFGISLILSGQRLDRSTISPRIFNNLDIKIAGRCDDVLSHIMYNDSRADELIPKDSRGLFINQNNELFRSYFIE